MNTGEIVFLAVIGCFLVTVVVVGTAAQITESKELCKQHDMVYDGSACVASDGKKYDIEMKKVLVPQENDSGKE